MQRMRDQHAVHIGVKEQELRNIRDQHTVHVQIKERELEEKFERLA
jgi:hypothetical protein